MVATEGWRTTSTCKAVDLARRCAEWPLAAVIYTDISRDGMLQGPNIEATAEIAAAVRLPVIASGGVTTLEDVARLARCGLAGCIVGRALYEGRLDLAAAIRFLNHRDTEKTK
jgi:phosphoribosylformimino-5-aminoimidazole carboxamide ribotide isomerase